MAIGTLGAALIGGGLLGSAVLGSNASKKAGQQVADGSAAAVAEQRRQFDQLIQLSRPGYDRANQAAGVYMQALGLGGSAQPAQQNYNVQPGQGVQSGGWQGGYGNGGMAEAQRVGDDLAVSPQMRLMSGSYTSGQSSVPPPQQVQTGAPGLPTTGGQQGALDVANLVKQTPGYQAQLDQGLKAIDRAAPLTGGMYSGRRLKALNDYGQNTFGSYYSDWMNRVGGMAGQAPQIAQNMGQAGMQNAAQVGGLMMTGANARANATINGANAWTGAIGTGLGMVGGGMGWF